MDVFVFEHFKSFTNSSPMNGVETCIIVCSLYDVLLRAIGANVPESGGNATTSANIAFLADTIPT